MPTLVWKSPIRFGSPSDEAAFFNWLHKIPCVVGVSGVGVELHIKIKSKKVSAQSLRELIAIYARYRGRMADLAMFENASNTHWFRCVDAYWYKRVFGGVRNGG